MRRKKSLPEDWVRVASLVATLAVFLADAGRAQPGGPQSGWPVLGQPRQQPGSRLRSLQQQPRAQQLLAAASSEAFARAAQPESLDDKIFRRKSSLERGGHEEELPEVSSLSEAPRLEGGQEPAGGSEGLGERAASGAYELEPPASSEPGQLEEGAGLAGHNSQLAAMQELFERRQLAKQAEQPELQSSQELSPISIGLDPSAPFPMAPFSMPSHPEPPRGVASADDISGPVSLSFGLNNLPHLLGFQSPASVFEGPPGPQRGDAIGHHHLGSSAAASGDPDSSPQSGPNGQKVYPKIFRFTDGRINLSDFEKQKKIRLSNKNQLNGENHIESAPIMFDGRQLKRKSFLILHGGIFS